MFSLDLRSATSCAPPCHLPGCPPFISARRKADDVAAPPWTRPNCDTPSSTRQHHRHFARGEPNSGSQLGGRTSSLVVGDRKKDKCPNWMESKPWAQTQTSLLRQLRWTPAGLCRLTLGR